MNEPFIVGLIIGLTIGIGGMAIWLVPKMNDLLVELAKANKTIQYLVKKNLKLAFKNMEED